MPVSTKTFEQLALEDPEGLWELHGGQPRRKPPTTQEHNSVAARLAAILARQLDIERYEVRANTGRVVTPGGASYVPDVFVLPVAYKRPWGAEPGGLEAYAEPLPLVVEVWSPSTGEYDVDEKLPAYMARGDLEIWRIHPYERSLTAWRRQPDGHYVEERIAAGDVRPVALPGVTVVLEALFR